MSNYKFLKIIFISYLPEKKSTSLNFNPEQPDFYLLRGCHTHWPPFTDTEFIQLQFQVFVFCSSAKKLAKMCKLGCSFALVDDVFGLAAVGGGAARGRGCGAYFSALLRFCSPDNSCRSRCTFLCNCSFSENSQAWRYSSGFATQHCILHYQKSLISSDSMIKQPNDNLIKTRLIFQNRNI